MKSVVFGLVLAVSCCASAMADGVVIVQQTTTAYVPAQEAAEQMARRGIFAHCRNAGGQTEGIGFSTVSSDHAIHSCCFWGKRRVRDIGVAWSPLKRGWVAVVRYY
jgi:hypothetical protein